MEAIMIAEEGQIDKDKWEIVKANIINRKADEIIPERNRENAKNSKAGHFLLKLRAKQLYLNNSYTNHHQASSIIFPKIQQYANKLDIKLLVDHSGEDTVYRWLLAIDKLTIENS